MNKLATIAADWWIAKLESNFSNDNGDFRQSTLRDLVKSFSKKPTQDQIKTFKNSLVQILDYEISKLDQNKKRIIFLSVDYDPCLLLSKAFLAAAIEDNKYLLPCKTEMMISLDEISVKEGYGAPYVSIYKE